MDLISDILKRESDEEFDHFKNHISGSFAVEQPNNGVETLAERNKAEHEKLLNHQIWNIMDSKANMVPHKFIDGAFKPVDASGNIIEISLNT